MVLFGAASGCQRRWYAERMRLVGWLPVPFMRAFCCALMFVPERLLFMIVVERFRPGLVFTGVRWVR